MILFRDAATWEPPSEGLTWEHSQWEEESAHSGVCWKMLQGYQSILRFGLDSSMCQAPLTFGFEPETPWHLPASVWEPSAAYSHAGDLLQQKWRQLSAPDCVNVILTVNHCHSRTFSSIALPAHCVTSSGGYADRLQPSFHLAPGPFITCSRNFLKLL